MAQETFFYTAFNLPHFREMAKRTYDQKLTIANRQRSSELQCLHKFISTFAVNKKDD